MDPNVKSKDMELWRAWRTSRSPQDLQRLLTQMNPIIQREVGKWCNGMSRSLLEMEGKRLAVEAFEKYDPNAGTALSTYLTTRLQKISRLAYAHQNAARLPETKALLFHAYNSANNELRDTLGREPTHDELSDQLGWSKKKLTEFQRQAGRREYIESEEHPDIDDTANDHLVDFIYHDLNPLQKKIFEYSTGYGGAPILSGAQMMKKLGITQGVLSYQKALIVKAVQRARGGGA